ncbi:vWA domain-containing protein [Flammeovirga aprica]|uniref:VWA domain-containing protein n=1 Tax=Flammeovirga aprica JL-4 TaxID=694437 RepID=A0A7X9XAX1_9BACT|nr:VWA domain-containing protein [Flammeovirga aprica]NME70121.1 VWA domain-containing protein [Flammeovirga aprica JL-4]
MRKLPVYLLLDVSTSMMGDPIEAVKNGLKTLVTGLRQDPYALETAYLSIITFNHQAQQVVPLTELTDFQEPVLEARGQTALGAALDLVSEKIDEEVIRSSPTQKGDWKPLVFIMTDGLPTDDITMSLSKFKSKKCGIVIGCAAGPHADVNSLKQITDYVVKLDTLDSGSVQSFFKWVSASISVSSTKIETSGLELGGVSELPPPPAEVNIVM